MTATEAVVLGVAEVVLVSVATALWISVLRDRGRGRVPTSRRTAELRNEMIDPNWFRTNTTTSAVATSGATALVALEPGRGRYVLPPEFLAQVHRSHFPPPHIEATVRDGGPTAAEHALMHAPGEFFRRVAHGGGRPRYFAIERNYVGDGLEIRVLPPPDREYVLTIRAMFPHQGQTARAQMRQQMQQMQQLHAELGRLQGQPFAQGGDGGLGEQLRRIDADPSYRAPSEEHLLVHADETGRLYHVHSGSSAWGSGEGRHWRSYVSVVNGTTNRRGSLDVYRLSVPVTCKTAREAVAWTYGLDEADYAPVVRT